MKNVLFTTTAVAALALGGTAFAAGHSSGNFGISGSTDVGYNDADNGTNATAANANKSEGGIFQSTNIDVKASVDFGGGYTGAAHGRMNLDWDEANGEQSNVEFKNVSLTTPIGTLSFTDDGDGNGASDEWYVDRDGMAVDVQNPDGLSQLKWIGDVGNFGYAVDAYDINNATDDDWSIGLGGDFGPVAVGLGYDNNTAGTGNSAFGISADFDAGIFDIGVSYADNEVNNSIGVAAAVEATPGLTVGAYYAVNDVTDDKYGVTLDYVMGGLTLAVDYNTGNGATVDEVEIDVSYDLSNGIVLYAGYSDGVQGATDPNPGAEEGYYVGAEIDVASGVKATIAYSPDAHEIGGPEFKHGTSAFLTLTY